MSEHDFDEDVYEAHQQEEFESFFASPESEQVVNYQRQCPQCFGDGEIYDDICPNCNGEGFVYISDN